MPSSARAVPAPTYLTAMLALVVALLGAAGAGLYEHTRPAIYLSGATLFVDQPNAISNQNDDGPLAKLQRVRYQYASVLNTELIGAPVARQLGIPEAVVEASLIAVVPPTTFTLTVEARTADASKAPLLAQAGANALTSYVDENQKQSDVAPINRIQLTEVLPAGAAAKVAPTRKRQIVAAALGFIILGVAFLIGADLLARRDRER